MHLDEREVAQMPNPSPAEVGWFAARQPGIVRFLEECLLETSDNDAFGVALEAAWRMCAAFEGRDRLPPPRVKRGLLDRANHAVCREGKHGARFTDGCAQRQPALCRWLGTMLDDPPAPLSRRDRDAVGSALSAVVYALDEVTTGRAVP